MLSNPYFGPEVPSKQSKNAAPVAGQTGGLPESTTPLEELLLDEDEELLDDELEDVDDDDDVEVDDVLLVLVVPLVPLEPLDDDALLLALAPASSDVVSAPASTLKSPPSPAIDVQAATPIAARTTMPMGRRIPRG